MSFKSF